MSSSIDLEQNHIHNEAPKKESKSTRSPMANKADKEIWEAFKRGDRSAFMHIYNTYFDDVFSYACQFTRDQELIKDAMQDLFVRLNDSKERLSKTESIKFYLFKSIKREIFYVLKKRRYSQEQLSSLKGQGFEYEASFEESLINRQINEEVINKIRDAANKLNDRQREIIFYHFFEGFSIKQIRELMNFGSVQATHNLLHRALDQLRVVLDSWMILWLFVRLNFLQ